MFNAFPVAIGDLINAALGIELIREKTPFVAKLFGKKRIDKRNVVVNAAGLENFLPAEAQLHIPFTLCDVVITLIVVLAELSSVPPVFDVFPQLETQTVWIDLAGVSGNSAGVMIGEVDNFGVIQHTFGHDLCVPVCRPTLVHDLGLRSEERRVGKEC